jgi:hypothetical protein
VLDDNNFSEISSSEYYQLSGNSSIIIRGQDFDNALISTAGSATNNLVQIADSGTIELVEGDDEDDE